MRSPQPEPATRRRGVTTGILKFMPQEELEGVLAHSGHIKNRDMLISTIAAGFAGAIGYLPYLLLFTGQRDNEGRHPFVELALVLWGRLRQWLSIRRAAAGV
jgi:Zn-dependent protease with chaperone function